METTPRAVADLIIAGARQVGADVRFINATDRGRHGFVDITMPDGTAVRIQIEID